MENDKELNIELFQKEIDRLVMAYLKGGYYLPIISDLNYKYNYERDDLLKGLMYYYIIIKLPTNTMTIWAYESKMIDLPEYLKGKLWVLMNWPEEDIFEHFNTFIQESVKYQAVRDTFGREGSLIAYSMWGKDWFTKLQADENKTVENELRKDLDELRNDLERDYFDKDIEIVRKNPEKYNLLVSRWDEIAYRMPKCLNKNDKPNYSEIARYIRSICGRKKITFGSIYQSIYRYRLKHDLIPPK
jgi:hypothetical protein